MKILQDIKKVSLNSDYSAIIKMIRIGQELPSKGNRVMVKGSICLPCNVDSKYLHNDLCFVEKCSVGGNKLNSFWGAYNFELKMQELTQQFYADTWKEAFTQAEVWADNELQKLIDALEVREQALKDAEE